jgi:thiol:disulfide interchange protein
MTRKLFVFRFFLVGFLAIVLLVGLMPVTATAQLPPGGAADDFSDGADTPLGGFGDFGLGSPAAAQEVTLFAAFTEGTNGQPARLFVTADMAPEWHVYSITQPPGAVKPTTIKLTASNDFQLLGEFRPDHKPEVREVEVFPVPLEEHYNSVTFSAPIRLAAGVDPAQLQIQGEMDGMVCHDERGCVPLALVDTKFEARLATGSDAQSLLALVPRPDPAESSADAESQPGTADASGPAAGEAEYRASGTHVVLSGHLQPRTVPAGTPATLVLTATSDPDWHIYAYAERPASKSSLNPTLLFLQQPAGWTLSGVETPAVPVEDKSDPDHVVRYHEMPVTWSATIQVPPATPPGDYQVSGLIAYQSCSTVCDRPVAAQFSGTVRVGPQIVPGYSPLSFVAAEQRYKQVASLVGGDTGSDEQVQTPVVPDDAAAASAAGTQFDASQVETQEVVEASSIGMALLFAFLGGLILNIMPCVLPVIGLKILSFFEQAGQSRSRAFWLNVWYSAGMLSVFMVLAAFGVTLSQMFTERLFGIIMAAVVFAMALSLMGLWELQVPSFLGSGKAQKLTQQEGVGGAFFKGIITTLLAIPCGAPLLSPAVKWAGEQVQAGAPQNVYLAFGVIGLGMATPYLIIGAFPELLRFLPKPGAWMETFKKAMGYFLLVAVVWILYFVPLADGIPTIALLFGIWLACWLVGRVPITASGSAKAVSWAAALLVIGLTYFTSFHWVLRPAMEARIARLTDRDPDWQPFTRARFDELVAANQTVLVDFTADWCLTCKTLEHTVLKTDQAKSVFAEHGVVTMVADWTDGDKEVTEMLDALGGRQVPVVAIFPAGDPARPIILRGWYNKQSLADAIRQAGPSADFSPTDRTAMLSN